ncbi:MAG: TusE/DsrC/DsvC family sulfur relay protein [Syntrophobacteraceae bacterium]
METPDLAQKGYRVDADGFLLNPGDWDTRFAEGLAPSVGIPGGLTSRHWDVIDFIRQSFSTGGKCPSIYEICKAHGLRLADLKRLFPAGYLRGACRLAGLTYSEEPAHSSWLPRNRPARISKAFSERTYRVDIRGFLIDPSEWDEDYAVFKALEMKMPGLNEGHWELISFIRKRFEETGTVPTVYEVCENSQIEIEDLESLFPDGYHRGALKIAGLRIR